MRGVGGGRASSGGDGRGKGLAWLQIAWLPRVGGQLHMRGSLAGWAMCMLLPHAERAGRQWHAHRPLLYARHWRL